MSVRWYRQIGRCCTRSEGAAGGSRLELELRQRPREHPDPPADPATTPPSAPPALGVPAAVGAAVTLERRGDATESAQQVSTAAVNKLHLARQLASLN